MTIRRGDQWGETVESPVELHVVGSDAEFVAALEAGVDTEIAVQGGDLWRTLGGRSLTRAEGEPVAALRVPIDLVDVELDDGSLHQCAAHVVVRRPLWQGGAWRGPVIAVMNTQWRGDLDVAPRGHPNDGRVEVLRLASGVGLRQRWAIRRRMTTGSHLPHPGIEARSVRSMTLDVADRSIVVVDGRVVGVSSSLRVTVRPDAAWVYT